MGFFFWGGGEVGVFGVFFKNRFFSVDIHFRLRFCIKRMHNKTDIAQIFRGVGVGLCDNKHL